MNSYNRFEIKVASFSAGLALILMGLTVWSSPDDSLFIQALSTSGLGDWWGMVMIVVGSFVTYGSARPQRQIRHHALYAAMLVSFTTFFAFLAWGTITLPSTILLWIGIKSLLCVYVDVNNNIRVRQGYRHAAGTH